ncbi:MAG: hypothetical protein LCH38_01150 [Proteobacteria bacterium]|nr:hypothetical protein [Pseudomonadota bacterium]
MTKKKTLPIPSILAAGSLAILMLGFAPAAQAQMTQKGAMRQMQNHGGHHGGHHHGGHHGGWNRGGFGGGIGLGFGWSDPSPYRAYGPVAMAEPDGDCRWVRVFKRWDPVHRRMVSRRVLVCD